MKQYIDKATLVSEIEARMQKLLPMVGFATTLKGASMQAASEELKHILSFINTLAVKEVDFEKEINLYLMRNHVVNHKEESLNGYIKNVAKHFFELGLKAKGE